MAITCPVNLDTQRLRDEIQSISQVALRERFDAFRGTSKERIARRYGVVGANVFAGKP